MYIRTLLLTYFLILYSGKFLKGLIFENFKSSQATLKIFKINIVSYYARALPECFIAVHE